MDPRIGERFFDGMSEPSKTAYVAQVHTCFSDNPVTEGPWNQGASPNPRVHVHQLYQKTVGTAQTKMQFLKVLVK